MANTFCYGRLNPDNDEIRILRVKSKAHSDPDHATEYELELEIKCIYEVPEYYAVSYVWGDESQRTPLQVDGQELMVPVNTAKAVENVLSTLPKLYGVDDQTKDFRIWIDAICINQSDHKERAKQVSRMKMIYSRAAAVIICLGDHASSEEARAAINCLHEIYDSCMDSYDRSDMDLSKDSGVHIRHRQMISLGPIYISSWFKRVWTIQESCLSKKAWCILGDSTIPLNEITVVATACMRPLYTDLEGGLLADISRGMELVNERQNIKSFAREARLFPIIKAALRYSASDPRDMVYGVLGLIEESCHLVPTVIDYTCPVKELFARVTVQSVILSRSLEPLQIASTQAKGGENDGFPSWSMRLDRGKSTTIAPLRPQFGTPADNSHWFSRIHEIPTDTNWKTLRLRGSILDEVDYILKLNCHPDFDHRQIRSRISSIHAAISASDAASARIASPSRRIYSVNTPTSTEDSVSPLMRAVPEFSDALRSSVAKVLAAGLYAQDEAHIERNIATFESAQRSHFKPYGRGRLFKTLIEKKMPLSFPHTKPIQRAFLITKGGWLGLGPVNTLPGDHICVFSGGSVPFVLNQQGKTWRLIGDAYIQGLEQEKRWQDLATLSTVNLESQTLGNTSHDGDEFSEIPVSPGEQSVTSALQIRDFDIE